MGANVASFAQANRSLPPVRAPVAKSELAPARADERLMGFHGQHHHAGCTTGIRSPCGRISQICRAVRRAIARRRVLSCAKNGVWVKIPASKINREESYDGLAHICFPTHESLYPSEHVFCFVVPGIAG